MARRRPLHFRLGVAAFLGCKIREFSEEGASMHLRRLVVSLILVLAAAGAFAQQTGSISGRVLATDGSALPGVTVEGRSAQLPQPRVTTTDMNGDYRLPALIPGTYTLTFTLAGMQ